MQVVPSLDDQQQVMLNQPWQAFTAADGNMIVADLDCVHVFSSDGLCQATTPAGGALECRCHVQWPERRACCLGT